MKRSGHALDALVNKLATLGPLSERDADSLYALPFHVRPVRHHDILIHEGYAPDHCTLMLSGVAGRERTTRLGARQLLGFYMKGDFVDLNSGVIGCAHDTIQVYGNADVACIPLDRILDLAFERPGIGRLLWTDTLIDASIAREWTLNVGRRDARTRLLHLLCEFAVRQERAGLGSRDELSLPLTQEHLADALGLTSVHVNRMFQSLRDEPGFERDGRTIRIKDWHTLARMADFDETYLRARPFVQHQPMSA